MYLAISIIVLLAPRIGLADGPDLAQSGDAGGTAEMRSRRRDSPSIAAAGEVRFELLESASYQWTRKPVRQAVLEITESRGWGLMWDRRIDPGQPVTATFTQNSIEEILLRLVEPVDAEAAFLGTNLYIGPPDVSRSIRTVAAARREIALKLSNGNLRQAWLTRRSSEWQFLATPQQILQEDLTKRGIRVGTTSEVPHDLWPATKLMPLDTIDLLTLLLVGFDRSFHLDEQTGSVKVIPYDHTETIAKRYELPQRVLNAIERAKLEAGEVIRTDEGMQLTGRLEDHERFRRWLKGDHRADRHASSSAQQHPSSPLSHERFKLRVVRKPLTQVVGAISRAAGLEVEWKTSPSESQTPNKEQIVSFEVADATIDDLLEAALKGTDWTFTRKGRSVVLRPRQSTSDDTDASFD